MWVRLGSSGQWVNLENACLVYQGSIDQDFEKYGIATPMVIVFDQEYTLTVRYADDQQTILNYLASSPRGNRGEKD